MKRFQTLSFLIGLFLLGQPGFSQSTSTSITRVNTPQKTLMKAAKNMRSIIDQNNSSTSATNSSVVCLSEPDVTIPANICEDEAVTFTLGAGCVTDPGFDDPATGGVSGFGFVTYIDPVTGDFGPIPAGAVGSDVFVDPNYIFFATNGGDTGGAGGCGDVTLPAGFFVGVVTGCDPVPFEVGVFGLDVVNFNLGTAANPEGCDITSFTMLINPIPTAPSLNVDGCTATITGACPNDVITISGGNNSGSAAGNVVTYSLDPEDDGEVGATVDINIANVGDCPVGFLYTPNDVAAPVLTCPATAACTTAETVSADLLPMEYAYLFVDVTGEDAFLDEIGIDAAVNGGAVQTVLPMGTFLNGPTTGSIVIGPILLGPVGSGPHTIDITVNDAFGDGLSFPLDGTITIYNGEDASGAVLFTATGNYGVSTGATGIAISADIATTGIWSGTGISADNGDGTATFMMGMNGTYTLTYTYTDIIGCTTMATCDVEVSDCAPPDEVPTVGEWGLIMLGLMMCITAIVGIRQRREKSATA